MEEKATNTIKEIRKSKGITQNEMAEKLGLTQGGYQSIESNRVPLTLNKLQQIADVFQMSVVEVIEYPNGKDNAGALEAIEHLQNFIQEKEKEIANLEGDKKRFAELSDERKDRLIILEKLTAKIADCLEKGYAILSKIEKQSPEIQKEIQDFVRLYDRLEEQIKMIDKET